MFTTRLSSAKHVDHVLSKCNAKVGYIFAKLPVKEIPLTVAIDIFNTYIRPIVEYCLPIWYPSATNSSKLQLNALYTKFLKRYLGVPYITNNAIVHFLTGTVPLCQTLDGKVEKYFFKIQFPSVLSGVHISPPTAPDDMDYNAIEAIPSYFWLSESLNKLPVLPEPRRAILYDIIDLHHSHLCQRKEFHLHPHDDDRECKCRFCNRTADRFHHRTCPTLQHLTPCSRLKAVFMKSPDLT